MIKIKIKKNNNQIYEVEIKGHANYADVGYDIVCASVSSIAITTVNAINSLEETIDYENNEGLLIIRTLKNTDVNQKLLNNLIDMLNELSTQYPKNIMIRNED